MRVGSVLIVLGLLATPMAQGDTLGIYAGAGYFSGDVGGTLGDEGVSLENELGFNDSNSGFQAYIAFEHPVPIIPNIKLATLSYDNRAQGMLDQDFDFGGATVPAGSTTNTLLDYRHTDITLYYELWDTGVDLDLGITARQFDVATELAYNEGIMDRVAGTVDESLDEWVPLLYGAARIDLPLTGLYAATEVQGIGYSGSSFIDYQVKLGWTLGLVALDLGVEAGYRNITIDVDEDDVGDLTSNVDIDGWFINGVVHF
ncbi:TIGR04219 family outer membrane beta-barrel protein [Ferrimonas pelagia]|uniref:TIGR04219 family outer membrane beta-barrel protein n=1 Tax=Ferrimonas pelagia TaxID=1177826 RepID=A0ABP9FCQ2_9GAMM